MTYGVQPTGYVKKPLAVHLAEIEASMVDLFGPGVVQTEQSPLGQLNGLYADLSYDLDERGEDLYQSFDPEQAEGSRLDILARYRLLSRRAGESDESFRRAITNVDRARIDLSDLSTALSAINGVSWSRVYVNEDATTDADGIPPNTVSVAVIGGDDDEVAQLVRRYVVPGVGMYGNTTIETTIGGFCRRIRVIRPVLIPTSVEIDVQSRPLKNGCPPPSVNAMAAGLYTELTGPDRPGNGEDGTVYLFRKIMERLYPNVEVVDVRLSQAPAAPTTPPLVMSFFQMMSFNADDILVEIVP